MLGQAGSHEKALVGTRRHLLLLERSRAFLISGTTFWLARKAGWDVANSFLSESRAILLAATMSKPLGGLPVEIQLSAQATPGTSG